MSPQKPAHTTLSFSYWSIFSGMAGLMLTHRMEWWCQRSHAPTETRALLLLRDLPHKELYMQTFNLMQRLLKDVRRATVAVY